MTELQADPAALAIADGPDAPVFAGLWDGSAAALRGGRVAASVGTGSPVLGVAAPPGDAGRAALACADGALLLWDAEADVLLPLGAAGAPLSACVALSPTVLATGSLGGSLALWDLRASASAAPADRVVLEGAAPVLDVDHAAGTLVALTADRVVRACHPAATLARGVAAVRFQGLHPERVALWPRGDGVYVGGVGRVAVHGFGDDSKRQFTFSAHRGLSTAKAKSPGGRYATLADMPEAAYAITGLAVHPAAGSLFTCGADGHVCVWNKDKRSRLFEFPRAEDPVVAMAVSRSGARLALAHGSVHGLVDGVRPVVAVAAGERLEQGYVSSGSSGADGGGFGAPANAVSSTTQLRGAQRPLLAPEGWEGVLERRLASGAGSSGPAAAPAAPGGGFAGFGAPKPDGFARFGAGKRPAEDSGAASGASDEQQHANMMDAYKQAMRGAAAGTSLQPDMLEGFKQVLRQSGSPAVG